MRSDARLPAPAAVRVARPTDRLDAVVRFYESGVGLPRLAAFTDHAGYSGVVLGVPDERVQVEFTHHVDGSPCPAPTPDNLLVLYLSTARDADEVAQRLRALGHEPVAPENPYWETAVASRTFADPDGWRVVVVEPANAPPST